MKYKTNKNLDLKIYHLSHTDLDGFGCQVLTKILENESKGVEVSFYNSNYGNEIETTMKDMLREVNNDSDVRRRKIFLITDLNLSESQASFIEYEINVKNKDVELVLLDHHISGKPVSEGRVWYNLDVSKSGTLLTYEYLLKEFNFQTEHGEKLSKIIDTYDLWKTEDKTNFNQGKLYSYYINLVNTMIPSVVNKKDINNIIRDIVSDVGLNHHDLTVWNQTRFKLIAYVRSKFPNEMEEPLSSDSVQNAIEILSVHKILEDIAPENYDTEVIENSFFIKSHGILIYKTENHISSAMMNAVLRRREDIKAFGTINKSGIMSLRSDNRFDVSKLAKELGGGGHVNAAGCQLDCQPLVVLAEVHDKVLEALENLK